MGRIHPGNDIPTRRTMQGFSPRRGPTVWQHNDPMDSLTRSFDWILQFERERIKNGLEPLFWDLGMIGMLDTYYSKQPRFQAPSTKPDFYGSIEFNIDIPVNELVHVVSV